MQLDYYTPLFNHMSEEHNLNLLQGELDEILNVALKMLRESIIKDYEEFTNKYYGGTMDYLSIGAFINVRNETGIIPGGLLGIKVDLNS